MRKYFQYLWKTIKSIFVFKQKITKEDKIEFAEQRTDGRRQTAKQLIQPLITGLEAYEIPEDKLNAVIDYTCEFFAKNHKKMRYNRMLKKIVSHFRLELLEEHRKEAKVVNLKN